MTVPYTTPGTYTFTVPAGVTSITVEAWGGGGSGGSRTSGSNAYGGGGGGGYSRSVISPVTPGQTYNLVVGSGSTTTADGGSSYFNNPGVLLARGGKSVLDNSQNGAAGATLGVGTVTYFGGKGSNSNGSTSGGGGGSSAGTSANGVDATNINGAAAPTGGGNGGSGNAVNGNGTDGEFPGGGGGGARRASGFPRGGYGGDGQILVSFNVPAGSCGGYAMAVTSSNSVSNSNNAVGAPDGSTAIFDANNDQLVLDLINNGNLLNAGGSIGVTWAAENVSGTYRPVRVEASSNNSTWTLVGNYTPNNITFQTDNLSLPIATRYIRFIITGVANRDLLLDAVSFLTPCTPPVSINTGAITPLTYCAGGSVSVPFTSSGTFTGNTYTAQLSNAAGSFATPTNIGTLASNGNSGTINATIPAGAGSGIGYRIRVISSGPAATGTDNGGNITINTVPAQPSAISGTNPLCQGATETYSVASVSGVTYAWNTPAGWTLNNGQGTYQVSYTVGSTGGTIEVIPSNGCGDGAVRTLAVAVSIPASITTGPEDQTKCVGQTASFSVAATGTGPLTYQWKKSGANVGTNSPNYTTPSLIAGDNGAQYTVLVSSPGCTAVTSAVATLTVNTNPAPSFTTSPSASICPNIDVTYTTQPGQVNYTWTVPGSLGTDYTITAGGLSGSDNTVTLQWLTLGNKVVTVNYSNGLCTGVTPASNTTAVSRPVPTFTTSPVATICSSTSVTYTTQAGQSAYVWNVPGVSGTDYTITSGGINGTDNTVTLQWLTSGSKTVTVNYNNANGCNGTTAATTTSNVNLRPVPTFTVSPSSPLCTRTNAVYTTQTGGTGYAWTVPGVAGTDYNIISGGIGTGSNTVTLQWLTAGSKTVTVNYTIAGCNGLAAATSTIAVNLRPVPTFTTSPVATICSSTSVTYTTQAGQSAYVWNVPGVSGTDYTITSGGISGTDNTVTLQWLTSGSKTVTVNYNNANGCNGTTAATTTSNVNLRPTPTFTVSPSSPLCTRTNAVYTTQTGGTGYAWIVPGVAGTDYNIISGGIGTGNSTVTLQWLTAGSKTVTVNYTIAGCNGLAAATSTIAVNLRPVPTFTTSPAATICSSTDVTYTTQAGQSGYVWSVPGVLGTNYTIISGGISGTDNTVTLQWLTSGSKTVTVNYNNADGCTGTAAATTTSNVNVRPTPTFTVSPSSPLCTSTNAVYTTQTGGTGYAWTVPGVAGTDYNIISGGIGTGNSTVTLQWLTAGSKTVTVNYTIAGCNGLAAATSTIAVNLRPVPTFTTSPAATICSSTDVTYTTQAGQSGYVWSVPGVLGTNYTITSGGISGTDNTVTLQWLTSGSKTVTVNYNNADGCTGTTAATTTSTVNVRPNATFTLGAGTNTCAYTNVTYTTQGGQSGYVWVFTGAAGTDYTIISGGASTDNTVTLQWLTSGSKTVTVNYTNANGCEATTAGSNTTNVNSRPTPTFIASPSGEICAGSNVIYSTESGQSSYVWTFTGTSGTDYTIISGSGTSSVTVRWLTPGTKTVTVNYNNAGGCNAITATSVSNAVNARPVAQITSFDTDICNPGTTNITGNVTASGAWTLTLSDGKTATGTGNGTFSIAVTPTTTTTYTLTSLVDANCTSTASDLSGSTIVTVNEPVVITSQPDAFQNSCATFPVAFTVEATGTGLTYQWFKGTTQLNDNANISGTNTKTLIIDQAAMSDAGTYHVVISGLSPCDPVTSADAVLAVNQEIVITSPPVTQVACTGGTAIFTVAATGTGVSYQWRRGTALLVDGGNISGAGTSSLTISNITSADAAANYNVIMTSPGGSCPQANSTNVRLIVNPVAVVNPVADKIICNGVASGAITLDGGVAGTQYNWSNSNTAIGLAATGTGNIASFTATNTGTSPITATITVTPTYTNSGTPNTTCTGTSITFTITVNPTVTMNTVANQELCNGASTAAVNFGTTATGGTIVYNWANNTPSIGLAGTGSGDIAAFTAVNNTSTAVTATITATPAYTNGVSCGGTPVTFTIKVNPTPKLSSTLTPAAICNNTAFSYTPTSATSPVTFNWSRAVVAGISNAAATGTDNVNETLINTTAAPISVVYSYTLTAATCTNTQDVTVIVNPTPALSSSLTPPDVCSNAPFIYNATSATSGTTFSWTRATVAGISNAPGSGTGNINETLINTSGAPVNVTYVYTLSANGCNNIQSVTVKVNPTVTISPLTQTICDSTTITTIAISGMPAGTITSWTRTTPPGISSADIGASGSGAINGTFHNTTNASIDVVFTITAQADNGCTTVSTATVTVNARLIAPVIGNSQIVCSLFGVTQTPAPLNGTEATGGQATGYIYQWQTSADSTTGWTNITGANSLTYQPPKPTSTNPTYYRLVTSNGCGTVISNLVAISRATDLGGSFNTSGAPTAPLCSDGTFSIHMESTSLLALFSNQYIRYTWQAQDPAYISSTTSNPFGSEVERPIFWIFTYTAYITNNPVSDPLFTVSNTTSSVVNTNLYMTPVVYNNDGTVLCNIASTTIPVAINPVATVNSINSQTVCKGSNVTVPNFTSPTTGGTISYTWANNNTAVGLGASGTGNIPSFTATNSGNSPVNATITVTPWFTNGGTKCIGTPKTFTITVNPEAVVTATPASQAICSNSTTNIALSSNVTGSTINWTVVSQTGATGATAGSGALIAQTLTATGPTAGTVIYSVTATANTCPGAAKTVTITVNPTLTAGAVSGTSPLCIGQTATFTTTGNTGGVWSSTNTGVASVNASTGVVTAMSAGTTNITYTISTGCGAPASAFSTLIVSPNAVAGTITGTPDAICIGATTTYSTNGTSGGTWSSSNTSVASVNSSGVITGLAAGTATISYTITGCNATAPATKDVTVNPDANPGNLTASGSTTLCIGSTVTYSSNGDAGTWSSSNTAVATVNASGVVTAVGAGTTNITYTVTSGCNNPKFVTATVTVNPNANAGTLTGISTPICVGTQVTFSVTGGDASGTWSTSNGSVATVNGFGTIAGVGAGTATITYTVNSGCNPPSSASKDITVVNAGALLNTGPITGPSTNICGNSGGFIYSVDPVAGATGYVWTVPAGWSISSDPTKNTITVNTGINNGVITVVASNACGFSQVATTLTVNLHNYWTGTTSIDWNTASNWADGQVPSASCGNVYIPGGAPHQPTLGSGIATVTNLHIYSGAVLTVDNATMQIAGTISNAGAIVASNGTIELNGNLAQTIPAATFQSNNVKNIKISNAAGVTLAGPVDVYESVTFGLPNSILNANGHLTIKSTETATAWVGDLTNHTINGDVTVERYINIGAAPKHGKAWEFVTAPVTGVSVRNSWMEGGDMTSTGYGTQVTGPQGTGAGFDAATVSPSLKYYDPASYPIWWKGVDNANWILNDPANPKTHQGYMLFVRGDRSVNVTNNTANATTLRAKGKLIKGPVTISMPAESFASIGNPYAAAIDMRKIQRTGGVDNFFTMWNSNIGGAPSLYGFGFYYAYTVNTSGDYEGTPGGIVNNYIQSGQAFFMQSTATGGNIILNETSKANVSGGFMPFFRPQGTSEKAAQLRTNFYAILTDGTRVLADGTLQQFSDTYSNEVDGKDARKFMNSTENLSIVSGSNNLIVERRKAPVEKDTVFYALTGVKVQKYHFELIARNLSGTGLEAFVEDTYLDKRIPLSLEDTTSFDYAVTSDKASAAPRRFRIVFKTAVVLPVTFVSVNAAEKNGDIAVDWQVTNESAMQQYEVEKSTDGTRFSKAATVAAGNTGEGSYNWLDQKATPGYNYYRIRSVDQQGKVSYSGIVKVLIQLVPPQISIYPNPITNGVINLHLINQPAGTYYIRLLNPLGQTIVSKQVTRAHGTTKEHIPWNYNLAHGTYQLQVTKPDGQVKVISVMY